MGWLILLTLVFSGCQDDDSGYLTDLPRSGGDIDEIVILVSDDQKQTELSDTLLHFLSQTFNALPRSQPLFDVRIKSWTQFQEAGDLLKRYRNLVIVADLSKSNALTNDVRKLLTAEQVNEAQSTPGYSLFTRNNIYSNPQQVLFLAAADEENLVRGLANDSKPLLEAISNYERTQVREQLLAMGHNKEAEELIHKTFDLSMSVPGDFSVRKSDNNFIWIRRDLDFVDGTGRIVKQIQQSIAIAKIPVDSLSNMHTPGSDSVPHPEVIAARDFYASKYILGEDSTGMVTESLSPVYQEAIQINNQEWMETRGLWKLSNPYMGGAFVSLSKSIGESDEVLLVDAFSYAGGIDDKRKVVRELEALLYTLMPPPARN